MSSALSQEVERKIVAYWEWFGVNAGKLRSIGPDAAMEQLATRLFQIIPGVGIGLRGNPGDDEWMIEVSPNGQREMISTVEQIASMAPDAPGWRVVPFRQPAPIAEQHIHLGPYKLDFDRVLYEITDRRGEMLALRVFVPLPKELGHEALMMAAFIAVDSALGEYTSMMRVDEIEYALPELAPESARPLRYLRGEVRRDLN